jgi:tetratricopeptide (TPR) repeat protein
LELNLMKASGAGLLAIVLLASGCRHGDAWGMMDPVHRAVARQDAAKGCDLAAKGDDAAASAAFQGAVSHDPHNAIAHANLGRIEAAAGHPDEAVRHYQIAVRSAPESSEYAFALADCLDRMSETSLDRQRTGDAAIRAYLHARGLDPNNLETTIRLGACYRRQGAFAEAIAVLREAETLDSTSARVHNELASTFEDLGDGNKALAEYTEALKIDPNNLAAHNGCGAINIMLSRRSEGEHPLARQRAIAHLRRSLEIDGEQPRIRALLTDLEPSPREMADAAKEE